MSKSVTNDQSLKFVDISSQKSPNSMSIVRRPKPTINVKLKNYRESSPATIQTISNDSIDQLGSTLDNIGAIKYNSKANNKLSMEAEDSRMTMNSVIRYSMPILPAKGINHQ